MWHRLHLQVPIHCPQLSFHLATLNTQCHGTTSPPSFSASFLLHPLPLPSFTYFQLHLTLSACPLPSPHQLQGIPMQLHYVHCQTSPGLMSDLLGSGSHAKGYHLYTLYNLSDLSSLVIMGNCLSS